MLKCGGKMSFTLFRFFRILQIDGLLYKKCTLIALGQNTPYSNKIDLKLDYMLKRYGNAYVFHMNGNVGCNQGLKTFFLENRSFDHFLVRIPFFCKKNYQYNVFKFRHKIT